MAHIAGATVSSRRSDRGRRGLILSIAIATAFAPVTALARDSSLEQAIKASYLFKFAPFITWPDRALAGVKTFTICVVGEDPFGAVLDDVVRGQKITHLPIAARRFAGSASKAGCQIVFAGRAQFGGNPEPFADLAGQPVLTVTDAGSGASGAMIRFVTQGGRVRFQIDDVAARAHGLIISSKLLGLAVSVDKQ